MNHYKVLYDFRTRACVQVAPYPMSDASVNSFMSEDRIARDWGIMVVVFHVGRKSSHHWMSALAGLLSEMW